MMTYRGRRVTAPARLNLHTTEVSGHHASAAVPPKKRPGTHGIGSYMCPKVGLDVLESYVIQETQYSG
jgi:hypothetical protein